MKKYNNRWMMFFVLLLFLLAHSLLHAQSLRLNIKIHKVRKPGDTIHVLLWKGKKGFPRDKKWAFQKKSVKAKDTIVSLIFENLPLGEYAVSCFYDKNNNRKYDRNWFFHTAEPFGLLGHPDYKHLPVKYKDSKFLFISTDNTIHIDLHYVENAKSLLSW